MILDYQYVWLLWSSAFLVPWAALYILRPALRRHMLKVSAATSLLGLYGAFMLLLVVFAPGYVEQVWNLPALSGALIAGIPLEELAFGFAFGAYWAGLYEHFTWRRSAVATAGKPVSPGVQHG